MIVTVPGRKDGIFVRLGRELRDKSKRQEKYSLRLQKADWFPSSYEYSGSHRERERERE